MGNYNPCADIRAASHAMRRRFDSLDIGKPSGLTPSQCRIMGFIMDNGGSPVYQKDIEAEFNIRRSTATRLLQSMEHKDLIMREPEENDIAYGYRLLEAAGKKRGFLISGGEVDTERMAKILLDEFRSGKLGRFTLELPE